jgi:AcrR family transcriptional regulator
VGEHQPGDQHGDEPDPAAGARMTWMAASTMRAQSVPGRWLLKNRRSLPTIKMNAVWNISQRFGIQLVFKTTGGTMEEGTELSRRDRRRAATRAEILSAARELLLEVGPEAISLRQVARRADFSPGALYTYFSSRDEIIASLFKESFERLDSYLRRVPLTLSPEKRVVELGLAYMEFAQDNPMDLRCILQATSTELPPSSGRAVGLEAANLIGQTFREGMEQGVFSSTSGLLAPEMAYGCWALVHGLVSIGAIDTSLVADEVAAVPRRIIEAFVALLMAQRSE